MFWERLASHFHFLYDTPAQTAFLVPGPLCPANVNLQRGTWKAHQQKYQHALLQECELGMWKSHQSRLKTSTQTQPPPHPKRVLNLLVLFFFLKKHCLKFKDVQMAALIL